MLAEVARRGSFSAAADAMCFTPSAVSQQMSALARDTGVDLFERTPRGMRLTESGEALVAHAQAVFAQLGEAQAELEAIAGGAGGRIRFGSFPTATMAFGAEAIEVFRTRCPGVEVRFADGEPYENVARLKERVLDLAVLFDFDHWTAVTDYDGRAVCDDRDRMRAGAHHDRSARGRVPDGIVDQDEQDPRNLGHPAFDVGQRRRDVEAEVDPAVRLSGASRRTTARATP